MLRRAGIEAVLAIALVDGTACAVDETGTGTLAQGIIGGETSDPGEYPATGALLKGGRYRCTATLIAPDVALTAAHCLGDTGWGEFGFTLDADLSRRFDEVSVSVVHAHPDFHANGEEYTKLGKRNDLGVVILDEPIEGVEVEELDGRSSVSAALVGGTELTLCGYGQAEWTARGSAGLKRDAVVYVDRSTNWELQSVDENPQQCNGDSGGPLFVEAGGGRRIAGIVSRSVAGSAMCDTGALYTRIGPYIDWINEASQDRDDGGCSVPGRRGGAAAWPALLACVLIARRRRR
jgi:secreted trypsin-like serine protease